MNLFRSSSPSGRNSPVPRTSSHEQSEQPSYAATADFRNRNNGARGESLSTTYSDNSSSAAGSNYFANDDDRSMSGAPASTLATSVDADYHDTSSKKLGFGVGQMSLDANDTREVNASQETLSHDNSDAQLQQGRDRSGTSGEWAVDSKVTAAGVANVSTWEQTEASSMSASGDPIAQATDFQDGDIIFLSAETGHGATRQPATRFCIHEVNLNVHSNVLSEMVDGSPEGHVHQLEEDGATLKIMFGLFYNNPAPGLTMSDWQVILRLARAAQKYDCARGKDLAAAFFAEQEQQGSLSPFMTYAFATMYHLPALEEAAAERSVRYDIHRLPELVFNLMGYAAFQKLSAFHTRRQTHYHDVLNSITMDPKELADQCYQTGGVCVIAPWNKLKQKLAWPRQADRDGSKKPPEPADVIRKLVTEIGQIDCGTCSKALVEGALQAQLALESMPRYSDDSEESF